MSNNNFNKKSTESLLNMAKSQISLGGSTTRLLRTAGRRSSIVLRQTADGSSTYTKTVAKERTDSELDEFKREIDIDDHYISLEQLCGR